MTNQRQEEPPILTQPESVSRTRLIQVASNNAPTKEGEPKTKISAIRFSGKYLQAIEWVPGDELQLYISGTRESGYQISLTKVATAAEVAARQGKTAPEAVETDPTEPQLTLSD